VSKVDIESRADDVMRYIYQQGEKAMLAVAMQAESYAKDLCPVDTGTLRNSITHGVIVGNGEVSAVVGTNTEYAPFVELGHSQQPGRYVPAIKKRLKASFVAGKPFIRPSIENHVDEYTEMIVREFNG